MQLLPVDDALKAITDTLSPLMAETVLLKDAALNEAKDTLIGRVLAEDVFARLSHPPHDVSAMDGYAIRHVDLDGKKLTIIGESAAGHPFPKPLGKGEAVRIFTGAHCPSGSDTIIIQENADQHDAMLSINQTAPIGRHIRPKGNDFNEGDRIAEKGIRITARLLALIASAGLKSLSVYPRPRIAIISTGDELLPPGMPSATSIGTASEHGQIVASNGLFLKNYLTWLGAEAVDLGIVADNDHDLNQALKKASFADLIITSGGASVGKHDGVAKAISDEGLDGTSLNFWRIAMRPGKPLIFGNINGTPLLGLPGNPVSTGVCAMVFGSAAVKALTGQDISKNWGLNIRKGKLAHGLKPNDKRQDYLRATLEYDDDGTANLTAFEKQDSGMMQYFANADALIIRPPHAEEAASGEVVNFLAIPDSI